MSTTSVRRHAWVAVLLVGAALFLASSDADYINAQTLNVDGGNWMS